MYFGSSPGELGGTVSLGVPLPVIDRGQGSIAAALARSEAAEASRSAQQLQAQQTVSATWREAVARQQAFVDNSENLLRPGMFVQALVETKLAAAVDVPVSAVLARRDQFFVFIQAADGSYQQREVKVGEQEGSHITLIDGVKAGDRLVTQGAILLDAEANESL